MLVATPRPAPTESLMGYLLRLTEANGYPTLTFVWNDVKKEERASYGRIESEKLADTAGIDLAVAQRLSMTHPTNQRAILVVLGTELPALEVRVNSPQVCPECIRATGACEAFWDLRQAVACPLHSTILIDTCARCHEQISWCRAKVAICKCGANLATARTRKAPAQLVSLMQALRARTYGEALGGPFPAELDHLKHLDLASLCKLIWVLKTELHAADGGSIKLKGRATVAAYAHRVARILSDWPHGFRRFLSDVYRPRIETAEYLPHFRGLFSWLLVRLMKNTPGGYETYTFLAPEVAQWASDYWSHDALGNRMGGHISKNEMRWGSSQDAKKILGCNQNGVNQLIESGQLPIRKRTRTRFSRAVLIDLEWCRGRRKSAYAALDEREAASMIGVSIQTLRRLSRQGFLPSTYSTKHCGRYTKEDVAAFAESLMRAGCGKRASKSADLLTLKQVFRLIAIDWDQKAKLIAEIVKNPKLIVGVTHPALVGFQIRREALRGIFPNEMRALDRAVPCREAAKRLGCTPSVAAGLVRQGYLASTSRGWDSAVCARSLARFEERYEMAQRIARRRNVNPISVHRATGELGLRTRSVHSAQCTSMIIQRRDVGRLERYLAMQTR